MIQNLLELEAMGWKGAIRSLRAAQNRAAREHERQERLVDRATANVDRVFASVLAKGRAFDARVTRDPIKALGLRFSRESGLLESDPFLIDIGGVQAKLSMVDASSADEGSSFEPNEVELGDATVRPLVLRVTRWATFVAFEVANKAPAGGLRINWVKKSDPRSSAVCLLDEETSQYYYPFATSLAGEVAHGHPLIGIVAFDKFRRATGATSIVLSGQKGQAQVRFRLRCPSLKADIENETSKPPFTEELTKRLDEKAKELKTSVTAKASGCGLMLTAILGAISAVVAASWLLFASR